MEASFIPESNHGIMVDEEEEKLGSVSSSSSSSSSSEVNSSNSMASSSSDFMEDATSSSSSSTMSLCPPPSNLDQFEEGALYEMSSLMAQLPLKRGLSKHFQGKSQSFTSLANVRCLEDLVKPEMPYNQRLKSCKSYRGGLDGHKPFSPKCSSRGITKKSSRGSFSSLSGRKHSLLGSRPPNPPQRSSSLSAHTLLFA